MPVVYPAAKAGQGFDSGGKALKSKSTMLPFSAARLADVEVNPTPRLGAFATADTTAVAAEDTTLPGDLCC